MMHISILITLFISFSIFAKDIRFAYGEHNSPPYMFIDNDNNFMGGILYDLAGEVSKEMGVGFEMIKTPRTRLLDLLKSGYVDLYCSSNRKWVKNSEDYYWFDDIFSDENKLYSLRKQYKTLKNLDDIKVKLGTIKGFKYHPKFTALIDRVGRHDLNGHKTLIDFMFLNRIEVILGSKNIVEHYLNKRNIDFYTIGGFVDKFKYGCIISKKIKFNKDKLFRALDKFKKKMNQ